MKGDVSDLTTLIDRYEARIKGLEKEMERIQNTIEKTKHNMQVVNETLLLLQKEGILKDLAILGQ